MWLLDSIPAYEGGTLLPTLYNCGSGLADDIAGETAEDSYMHIVRDTDEQTFLRYCDTLQQAGFTCLFERSDTTGLYRQFQKDDTLVYTYFTYVDSIARIIDDRCSVSLTDFADVDDSHRHMDTALMQFGLWYDDMIKWTGCDCGMNYVMRLHNNKLIVVDGGEAEQATEAALGEFMNRIRKLTGTGEGDKMTIAMWYCTHPHDDHMDFFVSLLKKYSAVLQVERVMFNFSSHTLLDYPDYVSDLRKTLHTYCPDALFMKPHSGQQFRMGNVEFDIIYTQEDLLTTRADNPPFTGVNETSTVLQIRFEDGKSFLLLADADDDVERIICDRYEKEGLSCTYLQAAHHCINNVERLYAFIQSDYVLIPENRYNIHKRMRRNFNIIRKYNEDDRIILAGDYTVIFHHCKGEMRMEYYPLRGGLYDGTI